MGLKSLDPKLLKDTDLKDIQEKIDNEKSSFNTMADIVAQNREDIFDILKDNLAQEKEDEDILDNLEKTLEEKKKAFTEKLGEKQSDGIDLTSNADLVSFWKDNLHAPSTTNEIKDTERDTLSDKLQDLLKNLVYLEYNKKGIQTKRQLFKGSTLDVTKMDEILKKGDMKQILDSTNEADISKNIDILINKVDKNGHPFFIHLRHLYDRGNEGKIALRTAIFLFQIYNIVQDKSHNIDRNTYTKIEKIFDQFDNKDIPQIKGIHNTKMELDRVVPVHETLHDLNQKKGDVDLGDKDLGDRFDHDLTADFENGKAVDLDEYRIKKAGIRIGFHTVKLTDVGGSKKEYIKARVDDQDALEVSVDVGGDIVKIGTLLIDNKQHATSGGAKISSIVWNGDATNIAKIKGILPLDVEIDIQGIKDVKSLTHKECGHAGLTKTYKFTLDLGSGPGPDPISTHREQEASISNVTNISREQAERQAEEQLRERYQNLSWLNPDRINLFFRRKIIKEREVARLMKGNDRFQRDEQYTDATDRHQIQQENANLGHTRAMDQVAMIDEVNYPVAYNRINNLCATYIGVAPYTASPMTDAQFQSQFQNLILQDPPLDMVRPSLLDLMRQNNMQEISSNVLMRVRSFKAHQKLVHDLAGLADTYNNPEFENRSRPLIARYIQDYTAMPDFLKQLRLNLDDPNVFNQLKLLQANHFSLSQIQAQTLDMKIKILNRGEGAYHIDQENTENKGHLRQIGWMTRLGKWLDMPFEQWVKRRPNAFRRTVSGIVGKTVQIGSVIGAGIGAGTLFGPLGVAAAVGSTTGLKVLFAKFSHYTKEHEGQMKNQAVDVQRYRAERTRLFAAFSGGDYKWYHRFMPNEKGREFRHFNRYVRTTHDDLNYSQIDANTMKALIQRRSILTAGEVNTLQHQLISALVRLDMYRETGQNFFGSDDYARAEDEYHNLYQTVLAGVERLGVVDGDGNADLATFRAAHIVDYNAEYLALNNQYTEVARRFRRMRRKQGYIHATKAAAISGGLSYAASQLFSSKEGTDTDTYMKRDDYNFEPGINEEAALVKGDFNSDLSSHLSSDVVPGSSQLEFVVSPGVDSLPAHSGVFTSVTLQSKIDTILNSVEFASLSPANQTVVTNALNSGNSSSLVSQMLDHAVSQSGVDAGNQYLFAMRGVESVEHMVKEMVNTGCNTNPLHLGFDPSKAVADASVSGSGGDLSHRMMNAILKVTDETPGVSRSIPIDIVDNTFKRREGRVGVSDGHEIP